MVRPRLRNKSLREAYKTHSNYCVSLIREVRKDFYEHLSPALIADNKEFWKQVKSFSSVKTPRNIMLSEGNEIISNPRKWAVIFNNFFIDSIKNLGIDRSLHTDTIINSNDPVENAIGKSKNHPSVLRIHQEGYSDIIFLRPHFRFRYPKCN